MAVDGSLNFDTKIDTTGFNKGTNTIKSQADGLKSTFSGLAKAMVGIFAVTQLARFGKQAIDTASDLQEVQNVVDTAFGSMSYKMEEFAKTSIEAFGISKLAAKQTGSVFMAMGAGMGIAQGNASDMAIALTGLSADMSSFYNVSQELASTALKSIYTGETETLKQYGIVMTEANLQQYALSQGITKSVQAMSQAEKVQLRYGFVMAQTALAQGDFARTSNSWANQTRILSQQWSEFLGILGTGLIQVLTPVVKLLNGMMASLIAFANSATKVLASIFNIKTATGGAAAAVTDVSAGADGASTGLDNMGKSAEKAAKKAKKSTTSIDDLNVLTSDIADNADNAAGALGGLGGGGDYGINVTPTVEPADTTPFQKSLQTLVEGLKVLAKQAVDSFVVGFKEGIGDINLDEIQTHISGIGESLKNIFTDPAVQSAAYNWVISTAKSLGAISGSMASIGLTVAELFVGSIDTYLTQNSEFIKGKIVSMFDLSAKRSEIYASLSTAIADIFTVFRGDDAKQIGADLVAIFTNSFLSITELGMKLGNDILNAITTPITDNQDKIKTTLENILSPMSTVVGSIKTLFSNAFQSISEMYDQYLAPAFENIGETLSTVFSGILDGYNQYLAPTIDKISTKFSELVDNYISPMVDNVLKLFGSITDAISELWQFISPFVAWLAESFFAMFSTQLDTLWNVFSLVFKNISNIITTITGVFRGLIDFVTGVFTGDWDKAWSGIETIFKSVTDGISKAVSMVTTFIKDTFSTALTSLKNTVKVGMDGVSTLFSTAWNKIKQVFAPAGSVFASVWSAIKKPFGTVATWFETTFSKAWTAVKNVFSTGGKIFDGIKDGIASTFKTVVNGLISGINKVLSVPFAKINSMLNSIRTAGVDILGKSYKPFSGLWGNNPISVPSIPKLATGTVVPANYGEFMAILGDNKREAEVVSPLSTIEKAVKNAMNSNNSGNGGGNITIQCILDSRIVYEAVVKQNKRNTRITGKNEFAQ